MTANVSYYLLQNNGGALMLMIMVSAFTVGSKGLVIEDTAGSRITKGCMELQTHTEVVLFQLVIKKINDGCVIALPIFNEEDNYLNWKNDLEAYLKTVQRHGKEEDTSCSCKRSS